MLLLDAVLHDIFHGVIAWCAQTRCSSIHISWSIVSPLIRTHVWRYHRNGYSTTRPLHFMHRASKPDLGQSTKKPTAACIWYTQNRVLGGAWLDWGLTFRGEKHILECSQLVLCKETPESQATKAQKFEIKTNITQQQSGPIKNV